jgi:ABC-type phosphate/phosphonate transport system substrate-binding protein
MPWRTKVWSSTSNTLVVKDEKALMSRMENGQFDISIFRSFAYLRANEKLPQLKYVATLVKKHANGNVADHYNGVLISLKVAISIP